MLELLMMGALALATVDTTLAHTTPGAPPTVTGALTLEQALALARQFHPAAAESAARDGHDD